jgi:hypothetical protein
VEENVKNSLEVPLASEAAAPAAGQNETGAPPVFVDQSHHDEL